MDQKDSSMASIDQHDIDQKLCEASDHAHQENLAIDPQDDRKLLRKIDYHLMPIICLLLLCLFVDR